MIQGCGTRKMILRFEVLKLIHLHFCSKNESATDLPVPPTVAYYARNLTCSAHVKQ